MNPLLKRQAKYIFFLGGGGGRRNVLHETPSPNASFSFSGIINYENKLCSSTLRISVMFGLCVCRSIICFYE